MYEDQPGWAAYDHARKHFYAGHPLGNSVLGTTESITALTRDQMAATSAAGTSPRTSSPSPPATSTGPTFVALVEKACGDWPTGDAPRDEPDRTPGAGRRSRVPKPAERWRSST